jgi:hypothetical protein
VKLTPPSNAEAKKAWSYTSTPQYVFMACCLVKHRDKFTFNSNVFVPPHEEEEENACVYELCTWEPLTVVFQITSDVIMGDLNNMNFPSLAPPWFSL